ncbi:hypothetical protein Tco_1522817 [Tanacetum coccineum]
MQKAGTLTDEAVRNGSLKKNPKKRENDGEPNRDRNVKDENKMIRTGNAFATTTNPGRLRCKGVTKQIVGVIPKGLALRVVLVDLHSKDESGKGFKYGRSITRCS